MDFFATGLDSVEFPPSWLSPDLFEIPPRKLYVQYTQYREQIRFFLSLSFVSSAILV